MFLPTSEQGDPSGLPCGISNDATLCSFGQSDNLAPTTFWNGVYRLSSELRTRGFTSFIDVKGRLSRDEQVATQLTTCVLSGCSLVCSLISLYWFWRMKRLFRHKLIMILIFADVCRSFWYFIFTSVALGGESVDSSTGFCQATGFLIQVAIEGADVAVLIIAVHTALQVFRPTPFGSRPGGLYQCRYPVYAIAISYPLIMSSLAFIQGRHAFVYQGLPVCNLPIRPFWYRLAISWIPRYVIFLINIGIAIAIWIRADLTLEINRFYDRKMSVFGRRGTQAAVSPAPGLRPLVFLSETDQGDWTRDSTPRSSRKMSEGTTLVGSHASIRCSSDASAVNVRSNRLTPQKADLEHLSSVGITPPILEEEQTQTAPAGEAEAPSTSSPLPASPTEDIPRPSIFRRIYTNAHLPRPFLSRHQSESQRPFGFAEARARRETARRQIRLMFVYPIVYFIIWLVPFINHLTQYSNQFAQHPVFALTILTWISIASMGMVDSLVFSLREKPWKHIPGSDGTFWGSFLFWKHNDSGNRDEKARGAAPTTSANTEHRSSIRDWLKRTTSLSLHSAREKHAQHAAQPSDATSNAVAPLPASAATSPTTKTTDPEAANLETMRTWGFTDAPVSSLDGVAASSQRQEPYWFDRRLSQALGRTDLSKTRSKERSRRTARDRDMEPRNANDDNEDLE